MQSVLKSGVILMLWQALALQAMTVTNIAPGSATGGSLFLKSDGSLWAMGYNAYGQLGDGTTNNINRPKQIVSSGVVAVAGGAGHTLFLKSDGSLWGMGYNFFGQLGDGTFANTNRPEQIVSNGVVAIAAGPYHSLFLKSNGSLWAMGHNLSGELGDGTTIRTNQPEQIVTDGVAAIAAGGLASLFLKSDGSLWATGDNRYGQLGDGTSGTYNQTNMPEQIVSNGVVAIAAGGLHTLFLKSDGSMWAMGCNDFGQLGDGTTVSTNRPKQIISSNVVAIATGGDHSMFIKTDGSLWAMGWDLYGQLGDGTAPSEPIYNYYTNTPVQIVPEDVVAIAGGSAHSLFLKSDGSLWGMGYDADGELGDDFSSPSNSENFAPSPEKIVPSPQPVLMVNVSSGTNLQIHATSQFGGVFRLLARTNLTQPLNQWTPVWTKSVTTRGTNNVTATLTNLLGAGAGQQYFILQSQ